MGKAKQQTRRDRYNVRKDADARAKREAEDFARFTAQLDALRAKGHKIRINRGVKPTREE